MKWDWGLTPLHLSLFVWSISRARCEQHMSLAEAFIPFNSQWLYCPTVPPQHRGQTVFTLPADWNVMDKNSFPLDYLKNMQEADSITFIHLFVEKLLQVGEICPNWSWQTESSRVVINPRTFASICHEQHELCLIQAVLEIMLHYYN